MSTKEAIATINQSNEPENETDSETDSEIDSEDMIAALDELEAESEADLKHDTNKKFKPSNDQD